MQAFKPASGFRKDINGLRAWAVVAVLLFHFQVPGFTAGFIGVDIFFVISGFLMTGIILRGLEQGNLSLWPFYMARARRIIPALMVLLVVLLVLGWFWLPTPDYQSLGAQSAYSLGFLSNIGYWRSAGYFDGAAHEKWLLHTWSLGIEMQFYLLYPVFALLVWKIKAGVKTFAWSLVVLFFLSLALSVVVSSWKPTAAFYLLPTRGWELAAGGLVYLLGRNPQPWQQHGKLMYGAGLLLWLISFVVIDSSLPWPSGWALLPVVGTALIILAEQNHTRLMTNRLAQWLGNISYSLYLWHWPLVVALYFADLQQQWPWTLGGLALSLLLGQLSYRWVENPIRRGLTAAGMGKQIVAFVVTGAFIGVAAVGVRLFSFDGRLPEALEIAAAEVENRDPRRNECGPNRSQVSPGCIYGDGELGAVLIGDSHAMSTITGLQSSGQKHGKSALYLGTDSCSIIRDVKHNKNNCYLFNNNVLDIELPKYRNTGIPVVHVTRTTSKLIGPNEDPESKPERYFTYMPEKYGEPEFMLEYRQAFIKTTCEIAQNNPLYVTRPIPELSQNVPRALMRNQMFGRGYDDIKITLEEYHERHAFTWAMQDEAAEKCGVKILDPLPYLCDDRYCYGSRNGRPLYFDDDHLSEYGNKYLVPMFEQVFQDTHAALITSE